MKKIAFLLSLLFTIVSLQAEDYQISFAGTGSSKIVENVTVVNQTQGKSISLLGSETLHLMAILTGNAPLLDNVDFPIHIYPNPSSDFFTVEFSARKSSQVIIRLYDMIGKEIAHFSQALPSGNHSFRVSGLNYGIYTIKIDLENQSYSGKLISQGSSNSQITINYLGNKGTAQLSTKLKNATTEKFWQYTAGDILRFTGTSGNLIATITDTPIKSKILTFNFMASLPTDPYRASISTGPAGGYNFSNEVGINFTFGIRVLVTVPVYIDPSGNDGFVYISIPDGKNYLLTDILGFPENPWIVAGPTDIRAGFQTNRIYSDTQSFDTSYGGQFFLTISPDQNLSSATVSTMAATEITTTSAILGGIVMSDGNASVTERGIVYRTIANPTTLDTKVINGLGIGTFSSTISGLSPNTTYFVRAFASNSQGTTYGPQTSFKTFLVNTTDPYRASMSTGPNGGYNFSNEKEISIQFGFPISLDSQIYVDPSGEYGFLYLSIPTGKTFKLMDGVGVNLMTWVVSVGTDNRTGYRSNTTYQYNGGFTTDTSTSFLLIIN